MTGRTHLDRDNCIDIDYQPASLDIWDSKYRLKNDREEPIDKDMEATFERVAKAVSEIEHGKSQQRQWHKKFLWALKNGAIPAGRIVANAGSLEHKPATSTINCTVSGTINDSMDDILAKVHEAGLTLKAGCGIGYEFSTLRPRNAFVAGAGAYTSGPLSFMDIYDKMCFTVASAGGRRGAQMATFDISHPDVLEFIHAKRESARLRQFNLSLMITREFMEAVAEDADWPLVFPLSQAEVDRDRLDVNDPAQVIWKDWHAKEGYLVDDQERVAHRVYTVLKARNVWNVIMTSTYDYAEPGFVLIDKVNEMNNNWFCETIRATNPCVTADTWVHTTEGPRQVGSLIGRPFIALVDGKPHESGAHGFFKTATKPVVQLQTAEGYTLRLTPDHKIKKVTRFTRYMRDSEWCAAGDLGAGDRVVLNNHRAEPHWEGDLTYEQGYLLGLLIGDGTLRADKAILSVWSRAHAINASPGAVSGGVQSVMEAALTAARTLPHRSDFTGWHEMAGRGEYRLATGALTSLALHVGMKPGNKAITPTLEQASSTAYRGFLRGFFDADGSVQGTREKGISVRLAQSNLERLEAVQRMLLRLGIASTLYRDRRDATHSGLPDGNGGHAFYAIQPQHELVISGDNLHQFEDRIGFSDIDKSERLRALLKSYKRSLNRERFVARITQVIPAGTEAVYDVEVPGINTFDANGLHTHNCGEQPLPAYGSCLLGSVNLTKFVENPFTPEARFNWDKYRKVVDIFCRMLDNVVEIHGLPLPEQQREILDKRRHGMGYLGLGSTLAMLRMSYGDERSLAFTEAITKEMAMVGWRSALDLAREKGAAPILEQEFEITPELVRKRPELLEDGYQIGDRLPGKLLHAKYSHYMQQIAQEDPKLVDELAKVGARFTHHSSIAPTGTISLSLANNASNGIEPSFAHHYSRNVIRSGKKTKEKVDVFSFELLAYRKLVNENAMPYSDDPEATLPEYFVTSDDIAPKQHVDIQAAAQKWIDSSISKTANVPGDYRFDDFKDIYRYAYERGLKGCTTFRFNPEAFQGVLVREQDLASTTYAFKLEDGSTVEARGNELIEYDGETHTAANLYDALKEGYYGKF